MKTKKEEITARPVYKRYTAQFKEQAPDRADQDGILKVAQDLGIADATLFPWWAKRWQTGQPFEDQKLQQAEMARLKRENTRIEEEVAFLIPTYMDSSTIASKFFVFNTNNMSLNCSHISGL